MKRKGSWTINFIVRALTGMGSIFLVNQLMDYRMFCHFLCPDVLEFRGLLCFMALCFINLCRCCAKRFFLVQSYGQREKRRI